MIYFLLNLKWNYIGFEQKRVVPILSIIIFTFTLTIVTRKWIQPNSNEFIAMFGEINYKSDLNINVALELNLIEFHS